MVERISRAASERDPSPPVGRTTPQGETSMAKGQKRSGREPKKPKQMKTKTAAPASPFAAYPKAGGPAPGKRK
jgi:hypothetical protein